MNRIIFILLVLNIALISACANQTAPTGGDKDETPPVLVSSIPNQGELNFQGNEIILTFDELIKTDNPKEQFLITPRIKDEYDIKYKKNKVIIRFEKPLDDSTTYSINFREGIKDLTEGNPADTLKLAFSTGSYLDSLSISGYVYDLMTNRKAQDITIAIYDAKDTLDIFNSPPVYYTKTNSQGIYNIENLKNSVYKIYALQDKNKNLTLESKSEKYGFISENIHLDSNFSKIDIPIQLLDVRDVELQSSRPSGTTYSIKYNKHLIDYNINSLDSTVHLYSNYTDKTHNTIQLFNDIKYQDSIAISILAKDSLFNEITDTIKIKFEATQRKPADFTAISTIPTIITKTPVFKAELKFNKPVKKINYDSIYLYLDSANIVYFKSKDLNWNQHRDEVTLTYDIDPALFISKPENIASRNRNTQKPSSNADTLKANRRNISDLRQSVNETDKDNQLINKKPSTDKDSTKLKLEEPQQPHFYAAPSTFISAESDSSKRIKEKLSFVKPEELGVLLMDIQTDYKHYFVQLINSKYEVIAEEVNGKTFQFKNIEPSEYRIRILVDSNLNGIWDSGNVKNNQEPEPVIFYKNSEGNEILTLRANWELGPNVISF
ncbi:Ig-like domain-containing protein [Fulvivirga sp. 29W222]|uniref:Ig-like domain-containing protein n=1 Tax=Fulvivirga marina TaxID=2494733 RepID=A0A937KAW2_9BACT|nr:Ig-like domain-containing protein [Fulvivirga marina]MBL6446086.1 Ig-like domain-containing protein [Fulvivirga marina]